MKKGWITIIVFLLVLSMGYIYLHMKSQDEQLPVTKTTVLEEHKESISLLATGDILMHNTVIASGKQGDSYNYDHLFAPVQDLIRDADYASVCLESALAGPETGYTGYPMFNAPDALAKSLKTSGFDLVSTASNHSLDRGYKGAVRTIDVLQNAGLDTIGTYTSPADSKEYLIKDIRGVKVGYLTYTYGTNGIPVPEDRPYFIKLLDQATVLSDIEQLRPSVDVLVLILHWGVEYSPYPTEKQQEMAQSFFEQGADVILGSHPHVIEPAEVLTIDGKQKVVLYSMGNSVGNQHGVERNSGVIVRLSFTKDFNAGETNLTKVEYTPTYSHDYYKNGKLTFRVIPIERSIETIKQGNDPYMQSNNIPLLQGVLETTNKILNDLAFP